MTRARTARASDVTRMRGTGACVPRTAAFSAFCAAALAAGCSTSAEDASPPRLDASIPVDAGSTVADAGEDVFTGPVVQADAGPRRYIPADVLARKAISYSGYRANESPETPVYPTEAEVTQDLQLLVQGGWTFIRLFDCSPFSATVLKVIKDNDLDVKIASGIWIAGGKAMFDAQNKAQMEQCFELYATYGDIVATVSVGNETLDSWSSVLTPAADLADYIRYVRARVTQPVTTDDMYLPFTLGDDGTTSYADVLQVAQAVDYLSLHVYAFVDAPYGSWDWEQLSVPAGPGRATAMMSAAMDYTKSSLAQVTAALGAQGLTVPFVIGEAGWKSFPGQGDGADPTEPYRAHPVNESIFYDAIESWVYGADKDATSPGALFYFEAFDEPWKGSDDGWGLFDVSREAKYVLWDAFPDLKPANAPDYTSADAVYYGDPAVDGGSAANDDDGGT